MFLSSCVVFTVNGFEFWLSFGYDTVYIQFYTHTCIHVCVCLLINVSVVNLLGPEFNLDCWLKEKFNLGLDFPNVGEVHMYI